VPLERRLEQVSKVLHRRRYGIIDNTEQNGFGKFGIVLVGDFGQLPPVLATSLIGRGIQESKQAGLRTRSLQGQLRFQEFTSVVCLKGIYKQKIEICIKIRLFDYGMLSVPLMIGNYG
jgi:hypothetical protein